MTDTEEQEILETPKPQKKPRKKRVLSEQDKERLRQNLKVGRQTALANRQKKALINKALKKEKEEEDDKFLAEKILKKKDNNEETFNLMKSELNELREELKKMKEKPEPPKPKTPEPIIEPEPIKLKIEPEPPKPKTPEPVIQKISEPVIQKTFFNVRGRKKNRGYY